MKKAVAIFFLFILLLPAFYKVGFFTFYQLNKDFIAENYCVNKDRPITICYGQCFLNRGMQLTDDVPNPNKLVSQVKSEMPSGLPDSFKISFSNYESSPDFSEEITPSLSEGVPSFLFRPPLV